jgi:large subunit ribosomal protein L19
VRRIGANEIGIERIWPPHSPLIDKVDILSVSKTRRAKLYYLRERSRREARMKLRKVGLKEGTATAEPGATESQTEK